MDVFIAFCTHIKSLVKLISSVSITKVELKQTFGKSKFIACYMYQN